MSFKTSLKQQFCLLFKRKSFYIAFALFFAYSMFGVIDVIHNDCLSALNSPGNPFDFAYMTGAYMYHILFSLTNDPFIVTSAALIICVLPFADSFYTERKNGFWQIMLTKTRPKNYYLSKLTVIFISAAVLYLIPLIANQLMLFAFFPIASEAGVGGFESVYTYNHFIWIQMAFAPKLMYLHPYIYNLLCDVIFSCFMGLAACAAFCASYYIRRYRVVVISLPFLFGVISSLLDSALSAVITKDMYGVRAVRFGLYEYLGILQSGMHDSPWFFILLCAAIVGFIIVSTRAQIKRDVL